MLRLRDIMTTDVLTVSPTTTLREAAELLSTRHIGGAPVVDGTQLVGVVSAGDILAFAAAVPDVSPERDEPADWDDVEGWTAWDGAEDPPARFFTDRSDQPDRDVVQEFDEGAAPSNGDALDRHTVAEVMTRRVVAMPPTADGVEAAARLRSADVHRVLVVEGDRLLGIVTTSDITRAVADRRLVRQTYVFDTPR